MPYPSTAVRSNISPAICTLSWEIWQKTSKKTSKKKNETSKGADEEILLHHGQCWEAERAESIRRI
jgi:hypothetical protein